jgi:hypothetical protein
MAKRDRVKQALERIAALAQDPRAADALAELKRALGAKTGLVVAEAARVVGEASLDQLRELLPPAFKRLMVDPVKRDPQCRGKLAVVGALAQLDLDAGGNVDADAVFRAGIAHRQLEPVWGGSVDSAGPLRGACAQGLAGSPDPAVLVPIAELLADGDAGARAGAIRAVVRHGNVAAGVPLLRLRLRIGDPEPAVLGECVAALLELDPRGTLPLAEELLDAPPAERAAATALALGEVRPDGALELLCAAIERPRRTADLRALMTAVAMLRSEPAWTYLVELVADAPEREAGEALRALAPYHDAADLDRRVREAVGARGSRRLDTTLAVHLGSKE